MERDLFLNAWTSRACPAWLCPRCSKGVLVLDKDAIKIAATKESMADMHEDWWDAEYVVNSFTAWAECSNGVCAERYALSGDGGVEQVPDDQGDAEYVDFLRLRHCHPPLNIIPISANCPPEVAQALRISFKLYWVDTAAAATKIRLALERLLDHVGTPSKDNNEKPKNLNWRIDEFSKQDATNGAKLMALKWLGNVASHEGEVRKQDVLTAFEVLEHALEELVDMKSSNVAKLVKHLESRYGPQQARVKE